jgi:hypothetical protein
MLVVRQIDKTSNHKYCFESVCLWACKIHIHKLGVLFYRWTSLTITMIVSCSLTCSPSTISMRDHTSIHVACRIFLWLDYSTTYLIFGTIKKSWTSTKIFVVMWTCTFTRDKVNSFVYNVKRNGCKRSHGIYSISNVLVKQMYWLGSVVRLEIIDSSLHIHRI